MILGRVKSELSDIAVNILGRSLPEKVVVFESDDWGSIRMASKEDYEYFKLRDYGVDKCPYNTFDTLEHDNDIEDLAESLGSVRDINGNYAKFTLNYLSCNPDYLKIRESGFNEYFYETILETYNRNLKSQNVYKKVQEFKNLAFFDIQFHGREHLNVRQWMNALKSNDPISIESFKRGMFSLHRNEKSTSEMEFLEAFNESNKLAVLDYEFIIKEGIEIFKRIWGHFPISFIAPCYIWPVQMEPILFKYGIKHIQSGFVHKNPVENQTNRFKKIRHYQFEKNEYGQIYTVRNVLFEPSIDPFADWVGRAMKQIKFAFKMKKPAIISSHRLNFVGGLNKNNKERNLNLLRSLLNLIKTTYPDVKFMTTSELYQMVIK